jgi:hypothetical protein
MLMRANLRSTRVVWHQLILISCDYEFYIHSSVLCEGEGKKWSWPISAYFSGIFFGQSQISHTVPDVPRQGFSPDIAQLPIRLDAAEQHRGL